jgi:hypothetical protein
VAYTLLGGFVVVVGLSCALPDIQSCLMAFKYTLISLVVKERVRHHEGQWASFRSLIAMDSYI